MSLIVETERLLIREFREDDAEALFAIYGDQRAVHQDGDPPWATVEEVREMIRKYPDYRQRGYGRWAVVYKPDERMVGFNGLKYLDDLREVDLGYSIAFDYWGRGIATESSVAILQYGFEILGISRIIGLVHSGNLGSIRVLEKAGLCYDGMVEYLGRQGQRWCIDREAWRRSLDKRANNS